MVTPSPSRSRRHEAGFALTLALLALLLVSMGLALVAADLELRLREHTRRVDRVQRLAQSDALLAESLARLAEDPAFSGIPRRAVLLGDPPVEAGWGEARVFPLGQERRRVVVRCQLRGVSHRAVSEVALEDSGPRVLSWRPD